MLYGLIPIYDSMLINIGYAIRDKSIKNRYQAFYVKELVRMFKWGMVQIYFAQCVGECGSIREILMA